MNTRSLRFRLVAWYAGWLIAVFVALGILMYGGLSLYLEKNLSQTQMRRARQIADTLLANASKTGDAYVTGEINSWFAPEANDRFIRITRENSSELYVSGNPKNLGFDAAKVPPAPENHSGANWHIEKVPPNNELLIASWPYVTADGKRYLVEVGAPTQPMKDVLHGFIFLLATTLAVGVALAAGGGYFLVRRALSPVTRIAGSAMDISLHNLKARLPVPDTADELELLSVSLNQMIERLDNALQHNGRFIADVSHELRTPLTIMHGELEQVLAKSSLPPDARAKTTSILQETTRLATIVEGLFAVSRLEAGEAQTEWLPFDLAQLAATTAEQMCMLSEDKGVSIVVEAAQPVTVNGDQSRMKQVMVNLLDNAIKYTNRGGNVRLKVFNENGKAVLEVEDSGIGIPQNAQPHIFERFFRVNKNGSHEESGAGLGLSIVKSICAAHDGQMTFRSAEGVGSSFRVELPSAHSVNPKGHFKNGN